MLLLDSLFLVIICIYWKLLQANAFFVSTSLPFKNNKKEFLISQISDVEKWLIATLQLHERYFIKIFLLIYIWIEINKHYLDCEQYSFYNIHAKSYSFEGTDVIKCIYKGNTLWKYIIPKFSN